MDRRQRTSYVNLAALICYIIGLVINSNFLIAFGLTIMTIGAIWTLFHWREYQADKLHIDCIPYTCRTFIIRTINYA